MKKILLSLIICSFTSVEAQIVSTFMETTSTGCYGLDIRENYLYVVSLFNGKIHKKDLNSTNNIYETIDIGGSGYNNICHVGNYIYISKPFNSSPGIYRFNPSATNITVESVLSLPNVFGLAYKDSELYFSASNKIYKLNLNSPAATPIIIANNILGSAGSNSTIGLKVFGNYLYLSETTGISKINLISGNYEKETITTFTGKSFAIANDDKIYLTSGQNSLAVYQLDLPSQNYSILTEIPNFIGTYDIVSFNNSLFVSTQEGDYNKVAKIDLSNLGTNDIIKKKTFIYPTLVDDFITLEGVENIENIKIINQNGQIKSIKVENSKINLSDLSAGIYYINTNEWVNKFIKK